MFSTLCISEIPDMLASLSVSHLKCATPSNEHNFAEMVSQTQSKGGALLYLVHIKPINPKSPSHVLLPT